MLTLRELTPEQAVQTWLLSAVQWCRGLSAEQYVERELAQLTAVPRELASYGDIARDAGRRVKNTAFWCIVDDADPAEILAACELLHRPCVVARAGKVVRGDGVGIASVFCRESHRRKGYAGELMRRVSAMLAHRQSDVLASPLYSDIGPTFYDRNGRWRPHESRAATIPVPAKADGIELVQEGERLTADAMDRVWSADAKYIVDAVVEHSAETGRPALAFLPTAELASWQRARTEYMASTIRGIGREDLCWGHRLSETEYCTWLHDFNRGRPEDDVLYVTRLRYTSPASLKRLLSSALAEARTRALGAVVLWNPPSQDLQRIFPHATFEDARTGAISCLLSCASDTQDAEWLFNERYAWC